MPRHPGLAAVLLVVAALAAPAAGQKFTTESGIFGVPEPVAASSPVGDTERLFVASLGGRVRIIKNGQVLQTPFLDVKDDMLKIGEGGLLGLAFHPDYAANGKFYIAWTVDAPGGNGEGDSVLSQFTVSAGDPDLADPASRVDIWGPFIQSHTGHKAGDLHFDPAGKLLMSLGDGSVSGTGMTAQDLLDPRGSILRFDVDVPFPHVPQHNPFVGNPNALDHIWHYGLRNPFRFSIDPVTGDMYIGDVGQSTREEINYAVGGAPAGLNFGWNKLEGELCFPSLDLDCPEATDPMLTAPIHLYDHDDGFAVMGGVVYRGTDIPSMVGRYMFVDHLTRRMWSLRMVGGVATDMIEHTDEYTPANGEPLSSPTGFGIDGNGDYYILSLQGWRVFKIIPLVGFRTIGEGLSGALGDPVLEGEGTLEAGSTVTLTLSNALASTTAALVIGLQKLKAPFKGGTLVPSPDLIVPGIPTGAGTIELVDTWPAGLPSEFTVYFQYWVADAAAPKGQAASNGLSATTP